LLVERVLLHLEAAGATTTLLDLVDLPADALLARRADPSVDRAVADVAAARILVVGTPVYRASYSGQLKAFFDLLPQEALRGRAIGLIATGAGPGHLLAVDTALRPLVASLRGLGAAQALYVADAQFPDKSRLPEEIDRQARELAEELAALATVLGGRDGPAAGT
jgi:FMN reductase